MHGSNVRTLPPIQQDTGSNEAGAKRGFNVAPSGRPQAGAGIAGGASRLRRAAVEEFAQGSPRRRAREWRHEGSGVKPATSEGPRGSSTGGLEEPKISSPMSGVATAGRPKRMRWSARAQRSMRRDQTKTTLTDFDQTKTTLTDFDQDDETRPRRRDQDETEGVGDLGWSATETPPHHPRRGVPQLE